MERNVDKRGRLDEEVFTYKVSKDNKVFISWHGKQVAILSGHKATQFLEDLADAHGKDAQLIMAKITGNFKHGNERLAKNKHHHTL